MTLAAATADYLDYIRHEVGHTRATHTSYRSGLRAFARWLRENGVEDPPIREISASLIRRYVYSLSARGLRPRTIRGAMHPVRGLFAFLVEMGALPANPALEVRLPKKDAAERLIVSDDDLLALAVAPAGAKHFERLVPGARRTLPKTLQGVFGPAE